jgi:hypothetical protein
VNHPRALIIGGAHDVAPLAREIHLRTSAAGSPFVVCSDRTRETGAAVRVTATEASPQAAFALAAGAQ